MRRYRLKSTPNAFGAAPNRSRLATGRVRSTADTPKSFASGRLPPQAEVRSRRSDVSPAEARRGRDGARPSKESSKAEVGFDPECFRGPL